MYSGTLYAQTKLAVLPFENLSGQFGADEKIMSSIYKALQKEYTIISASEVEKILTYLRVRHTGFLTTKEIQKIGRRLRVDSLLLGMIETYRQQPFPQVSFFCKLISTKEGAPIFWSKNFCLRGRDKVYLLNRAEYTTWELLMQKMAEDLVKSLPKNKEEGRIE